MARDDHAATFCRVLLAALEADEEKSARALHGLQEILLLRSAQVMPVIIPRLLEQPITQYKVTALGAITEVTGTLIHHYFEQIFTTLAKVYTTSEENASDEVSVPDEACVLLVLP